ncbi:MAG TPA: phosphotransferase [Acetobacteraceae bacterium]|nr:phosphotransferase [Acetobacteraceae bacterium]
MQIHGSCASKAGAGVLLLGPPGSGKSDLLLRLRSHGFELVADDRVVIADGVARPPPALAGLLEVRGIGIVRFPYVTAPLVLAVRLEPGPRLPARERLPDLDLPLVYVDPSSASAAQRVALALDCCLGRVTPVTGAFM